MNRWFPLLILAGALLGLFGQEAAFAQPTPVNLTEYAAAAGQITPECAKMMELAKQGQQPSNPCPEMTPDCVAKMGCSVALTLLIPLTVDASADVHPTVPPQMPVAALIGRDFGPEPEPPALLG